MLTEIPMSNDRSGNGRASDGINGSPGSEMVGSGTLMSMPMSKPRSGIGSASEGKAGKPGKETVGSGGNLHALAAMAHSEMVHRVDATATCPAGPATMELAPGGGGIGPMTPRLPPPVFSAQCLP